MFQVPADILQNNKTASTDRLALDPSLNSSDGLRMFYRAELFLDESELAKVNDFLSKTECPFGKPQMIEVRTPPLLQSFYTPASSAVAFSPLPARATRTSLPNYSGAARASTNGAGKLSAGDKPAKTKDEKVSMPKQDSIVPDSTDRISGPALTPRVPSVPIEIPMIPAKRSKILSVIAEAFAELASDQDFASLFEEYSPADVSPPLTMSTIKQRIEQESYLDHFQFSDDLIALAAFWLYGPPVPNPVLPQYMAALKLLRKSTDVMLQKSSGIENSDYYSGPDVVSAIKEETKRELSRPHTTSPSFARKVRRTTSASAAGGARKPELKSIEDQVAMLTEHVLGLQKTKATSSSLPARASVALDSRPLTPEEIRKLEADLVRLSPEDIDFVVTNMLKDEPSVRVDDESYELDVGALPAAKQKALRRFVSRRLNLADPTHEAQKLKQMLKQDELAKASEEMAERLLMAASAPPSVPMSEPEDVEADRQRTVKEKQREEEARRLWRLAHGDDDDSMDLDS